MNYPINISPHEERRNRLNSKTVEISECLRAWMKAGLIEYVFEEIEDELEMDE